MLSKSWLLHLAISGVVLFIRKSQPCSNPVDCNCAYATIRFFGGCGLARGMQGISCRNRSHISIPKFVVAYFALDISHNQISQIPAMILASASQIEVADFSHNNIDSVDENAFSGLQRLGCLNLGNNRIARLHPSVFSDASRFLVIHLNDNRIKRISDVIQIQSFTSLLVLSLESNQIENLPSPLVSVEILPSLQFLHLQYNRIKAIASKTFNQPNNLQYLYLANNTIVNVHQDAFIVPRLLTLDLSNNRLQFVHSDTFQHLLRTFVDLTGNILDCSTNLLTQPDVFVQYSDCVNYTTLPATISGFGRTTENPDVTIRVVETSPAIPTLVWISSSAALLFAVLALIIWYWRATTKRNREEEASTMSDAITSVGDGTESGISSYDSRSSLSSISTSASKSLTA